MIIMNTNMGMVMVMDMVMNTMNTNMGMVMTMLSCN
eukprot:CAMPEP_0116047016 /NCGR_PEP_ID=MMETSP0321-20121206/28621_1 /TAXON_ID=163516 /ORGANISM="Leptocylindrus danicus var. danicus, Strain B650" /LENGTH=35 /DNA_ID= /DNA_START= /DNA_END= /DNA_ORIENTATION=